MADITLLQQEILLLKLRIIKLESDKKNLESSVAVLTAERDQADTANNSLSEKLKNTEKVCQVSEWSRLMMESKYHKALERIEQLKNELIDALGSHDDSSDDDEDTPSATSIQEDN
jgi:ribosome-binding protein aMBF1 (putative translation factor)